MKKLIVLVILGIVFSLTTHAQFSFGVSPGLGFTGAQFGYQINEKFTPYFGFQFVRLSTTYEESYQNYDWQNDEVELVDELKYGINVTPTFSRISFNFYF